MTIAWNNMCSGTYLACLFAICNHSIKRNIENLRATLVVTILQNQKNHNPFGDKEENKVTGSLPGDNQVLTREMFVKLGSRMTRESDCLEDVR